MRYMNAKGQTRWLGICGDEPLTTYTRGIDLLAAPEPGVGGSETLQGLPHERKRQKWPFKAQANSSELQPLASFQSLAGERGIGGLLARSDNQKIVPAMLTPANPNPQNVVTSYYFNDDQGNVTALVSPAGMLLAQYEYDPFGNLTSKSGLMADMNKYRFSSKEWDDNAGLYYYGYRFYDPNLQRWVNRDPIGELGGINLFALVDNSPVDGIDPLGLTIMPSGWQGPLQPGNSYTGPGGSPVNGLGQPSGLPSGDWRYSPDPKNSRGGKWYQPGKPGDASWDNNPTGRS